MMASEDVIQPPSDSFWEVDCYKRTVKRQDDGHKLCTELMQLISDRGHIEKEYAKQLKAWSKKWTDLLDKGPEYGTSEVACKAVMQEAEGVADLHLEVRERLVNDVHNTIKSWRTENYHKSMVGPCKETKELDDGFKKAQKPWAKRYQVVITARKQYHRACKALQAAEDQTDQHDFKGSTRSLSFAQKPWAKRYSKVMKARKDYHAAVKQEKTATNQENNSKNDSAMSQDQMKKLQERVEKCRRDVESSKSKYEEALSDINSYNAKYMEDMTEVFNKCQAQEEKRLNFFKEMLFGIHKCLDLSVNPAFGSIYVNLKQQIATADSARDLKYWSENHGVDMAMNWPTFEDYSEQMNEISKRKLNDVDRSTVTLRKIRYHEDFADYAPEPHTISRKEKKSNNEAITLTSLKQNDTPTPTHVPTQQSYSNYSADEQTPPPSASSQVSQNRPPPPKPLRKQESYDPSLNPFTDDPDFSETESGPMPSPSQSKGSSRVSVNSQSEGFSHKSQSSIDTNPFADDMGDEDDEVLLSPKTLIASESCSSSLKSHKSDEKETDGSTTKAYQAANVLTISKADSQSSDCSSPTPATPEKPMHKKKGLAPRAPVKTDTEFVKSARARHVYKPRSSLKPAAPGYMSVSTFKHWDGSKACIYHQSPRKSAYDPGLNPFGEDDEESKDNQQSSKRSSTNNGSAALDEWADDAGTGMEEVMRVPVRALYDYNGQEEDELSFKSGDVFMKLKNEDDQGWCVGEKDGHVGLYPRDYVDVI